MLDVLLKVLNCLKIGMPGKRNLPKKNLEMQGSIDSMVSYLAENEMLEDYFRWAEKRDKRGQMQIPDKYKRKDDE